jgi:hypothetical protein
MKDSVKSKEAQHDFAARSLTDALKRCQKNGVSTEIAVQTILSLGATLLLSSCEAEDAASMLEGMAAAIRRGEITRDDA